MEKEQNYVSPKVEIINVEVERGFATSVDGSGEDITGPDDWGY